MCGCLESLIQGVWVLGESYTESVVAWKTVYRVCECLECLIQVVWMFGKSYTGFWCENLREMFHLGNASVDGKILLSWIFRK